MSTKKLKGELRIARPRGNTEHEYVQLELTDELSGTRVVTVRIGLAEFTEAVVGSQLVACEFDHYPERVGMTREWKEEFVLFPNDRYFTAPLNQRQEVGRLTLAPLEVDGWRGEVDDLFNHHRRGSDGARVRFTRYVETVEESK